MSPPRDTPSRLLDAAERAFADKGFAGASLREITAEAGANLAAAHYHFGSKEDLFVAVVARRMEPMNRERLRMLDLAEERAGGRAPALEEVLEAMVAPALRLAQEHADGGAHFVRLAGRMHGETSHLWIKIIGGPLREVRARMQAALARALPELDEAELAWRMHFTIAAMANVMADQHRLEVLSGGLCSSRDVEGTISRLVPFLAAGFRAGVRASGSRRRAKRRAPRSRRS